MTASPGLGLAFVKRIIWAALIFLAIALSIALSTGAFVIARSIAIGWAIALASFVILAWVVIKAMAGGTGGMWVAALGMVKVVILGAAIWWLLRRGVVEPIAFLGGFSTIVLALIIEGARKGAS